MALTVYGIKNCNTVKSALTWLQDHKVAFEFHDFKSQGISDDKLNAWSEQLGWEPLVNKRGMTWRQLPPAVQNKVKDQRSAVALMKEKTSVIKRPVIEKAGKVVTLGFDADAFKKHYKK